MSDFIRQNSVQNKFESEFEKIQTIGSGSFGIVFKVRHISNETTHAIKRIKFNEIDDEFCTSGIKELEILSKISSDYVVQYESAWVEREKHMYIYIQMELCENNLKDIIDLKRKIFSTDEAIDDYRLALINFFISCEMFEEIIRSLNFLHTLDPPIIHRDLKPPNILITDGTKNSGHFLKICDLGLAKPLKFDGQSHSIDKGDINYMSPEAINKYYTIKSDIYSLGLIATKDLFEVNVQEDYWDLSIEKKNIKMRDKYNNLKQPLLDMLLTPIWDKRPYCAQLLARSSNWKLNNNEIIEIYGFSDLMEMFESNEQKFFYNFLKTKLDRRLNQSVDTIDLEMDTIDGQIEGLFSENCNNNEFMKANELKAKTGDIIEIRDMECERSNIWALYDGTGYWYFQYEKILCEKLEELAENRECRVNNLVEASHRHGLDANDTDRIIKSLDQLSEKYKPGGCGQNHNLGIHFVTKARYDRGFCAKDNCLEQNFFE